MKPVRRLLSFLRWLAHDTRERYRRHAATAHLSTGGGVTVLSPSRLEVAADVHLDHGAYLHCGGMSWCEGMGGIRIGRGSYVGPYAVLFGMGGIEIGEDVMIAPGVVISSVQHPYADTSTPMYSQDRIYGRIVIEDDVYLGSNAVVTPGVRIGRGAVVGAGAVVTGDLPPFAVAVGVPARVVADRRTVSGPLFTQATQARRAALTPPADAPRRSAATTGTR